MAGWKDHGKKDSASIPNASAVNSGPRDRRNGWIRPGLRLPGNVAKPQCPRSVATSDAHRPAFKTDVAKPREGRSCRGVLSVWGGVKQ